MHGTNVLAQRTFKRAVRDGYLVADAKLYALGEQAPYFSVTGELWQSKGWYENGQDGRLRECGSIHERILRAFPKLAPLVALHLADSDGVPMHALANAWYAYGGDWHAHDRTSAYAKDPTDTPHERAARILRIDPAELPEGMDSEAFEAFVDSLRSRWAREASEARAFLEAE